MAKMKKHILNMQTRVIRLCLHGCGMRFVVRLQRLRIIYMRQTESLHVVIHVAKSITGESEVGNSVNMTSW